MQNNVIFKCAQKFVPVSDDEQVLSVQGAQWFLDILKGIPGIDVTDELCQEDWGIVAFISVNKKKFWCGLSQWPEDDNLWLAHIHHRSFFQKLSKAGKSEFQKLLEQVNFSLENNSTISKILWRAESDL